MKRLGFYTATLALMSALFFSCNPPERGNGNITVRERAVSDFDEVEIRGNYDLVLQKAAAEKVVIETDENLQDFIELTVGGKRLTIRNLEPLISKQNIRITVYYTTLQALSSSGSSVVSSDGMIKSNKLDVEFSGAGSLNLELEVEDLEVDMPGAGLIKLVGYANRQRLKMSGAGHLNALNLITNETRVELNGLGGADIHALKKLDATLNGVGSIRYKGAPAELNQDVRGMGVIKPYTGQSQEAESEGII